MTSTYTGTYSRMPSMWKPPKRGGPKPLKSHLQFT